MSRKRNESKAVEQPPVFRRSAAGIPLFSPGPKGRIITAKMVQDAEDNLATEEALEIQHQMELARKFMQEMPSDKLPSRAVMEKAFEIAEASLRLDGMAPGPRYYALKERVLAGEITPDQAVAELINAEHKQDTEIAGEVTRDNHEALRELGTAKPASKFDRSFAGFPVFPESGHRITTEMVREVENEMDIEDWQRLNPPK